MKYIFRNKYILLFCIGALFYLPVFSLDSKTEKVDIPEGLAKTFTQKQIEYFENLSSEQKKKVIAVYNQLKSNLFPKQTKTNNPQEVCYPSSSSYNEAACRKLSQQVTQPAQQFGNGQNSSGNSIPGMAQSPGASAPQQTANNATTPQQSGGQGASGPGNTGQNFQQATPIDCEGKKIIVVGFRGIPQAGGRNASPGVDSAAEKFQGKAFESDGSQFIAATQYVMSGISKDPKNTVVVVMGHSRGANQAINFARYLQNKNVTLGGLILADPSRGSAQGTPSGIPNTVALISTSPYYQGVSIPNGQTKNFSVGHFGIDNQIANFIPCKK